MQSLSFAEDTSASNPLQISHSQACTSWNSEGTTLKVGREYYSNSCSRSDWGRPADNTNTHVPASASEMTENGYQGRCKLPTTAGSQIHIETTSTPRKSSAIAASKT